jgi:hypothetical protein
MKFHEMLRKKSSQIPSTKVGIPRYSAGTVLMVKPLVGALRPCACPAGQLVGELVERLWLGSIPKCLKCLTLWICLVYKHGNRKAPCLVGKSLNLLNVHCRARSRNYEFYKRVQISACNFDQIESFADSLLNRKLGIFDDSRGMTRVSTSQVRHTHVYIQYYILMFNYLSGMMILNAWYSEYISCTYT